MYKLLVIAVSMVLTPSFALAQPPAKKEPGIEIKDYPGNTPPTEKVATLRLKGNAKAGAADYKLSLIHI